jgi:PAS domain S-box-containing protein
MAARADRHAPLTLATRLVQAVDLPDPIGAALDAVRETVRSPNVAFYAYDPIDGSIVMTHATLAHSVARDAIARHHLSDASVAARTLREQTPIIIPDYRADDDVQAALATLGIKRIFNLVSLPITVGEARYGVVQAINVARWYVGPRGKDALAEIATLFGAMLASARNRQEVTTLGAMIARVNESLHLRQTLDAVLEGLMTLVPSASASIYLDGLIRDSLVQVARRRTGAGADYPATQPRPLDGSLTGWVYRHRQSVNVPDILHDSRVLRTGPDALPAATTVRSYLMTPLLAEEHPVGVLVASRRGVGAFTDDDLRIVEQFAPLAARAVVNARLYARAEDARQQAEVVIEDMADAIVRLDRNGVTRGWNKGAERLFGYMAAEVIGGPPPLVPLDDYPETAGLWRRVLDRGESFGYIENRQRHKDGHWLDTLVSLSPWRENGEIVGAVAVIRDITARKGLERELARRVAVAEQQERDTAFVSAVAQACNSGADAPAMLQMVADLAARWADSASVVTFEGERVDLAAYASKTPDEDRAIREVLQERAVQEPERILERRVAAANAPLVLDMRASPPPALTAMVRERGYHTLAAVPIRAAGEVVGVLVVVARAETPPFTPQAVATLELVAEQAGLAISRERLNRQVARQVATLQRRERDTAFLAAAAQACNSAAGGAAILQSLSELTAQWADDARVVTLDDGHQTLAAYASKTPAEDAAIRDLLIETYARGRRTMRAVETVRETQGSTIEDLRTQPMTPLLAAFLARGYHSKAFVPIRAAGEIVGVLIAGARGGTAAFDAQSLATLELVAEQAGLAVTKDRLLRRVEAQVRELEAANRHKDDFLASLSHELRTPLNAILGFGELIEDGLISDPDELREVARDIVASGRLLLDQVNGLLDMARVSSGQMEIAREHVAISTVVEQCERVIAPLVAAKEQRLTVVLPPDLPPVIADEARLQQVLLNLLTNAHKFTPERGSIAVEAAADEGTVRIAVRDTGIGVAPAHARLIFEPFRRVETGYARAQGGTGLGLALSRRLVELMGGALSLESAPGEGSTFTVSLPANS